MTEPSSDDGRTFRRETERVVNEIAQGLRTLDTDTPARVARIGRVSRPAGSPRLSQPPGTGVVQDGPSGYGTTAGVRAAALGAPLDVHRGVVVAQVCGAQLDQFPATRRGVQLDGEQGRQPGLSRGPDAAQLPVELAGQRGPCPPLRMDRGPRVTAKPSASATCAVDRGRTAAGAPVAV